MQQGLLDSGPRKVVALRNKGGGTKDEKRMRSLFRFAKELIKVFRWQEK